MFAGLDADKYDRQYSDKYLMRRIASYFSGFRRQLWLIIAGFTIVAVVASLRTVFLADAVNALENRVDTLLLLVAALFIGALVEYVANGLRRRLLARVISEIVAQMRKDAFSAAVHRDLAFYDTHKTGKIVSRITSDTQEFGDVMLVTSDVISQLISIGMLFFVLLYQSVTLTLVLLATIPMVVISALSFRSLARKATRQSSRAMAVVNDNIQETVTGISVAKNFRKEAMIYDEFNAVNRLAFRINMQRGVVLALVFPVLNLLAGFAIGFIVYVGAQLVVSGAVTLGAWYLFIQGIDRFWFPFINLSAFWSQFQQGLSATERVFALIDADNTIVQIADHPAPPLKGHIEFHNVTFAYGDGESVLKNFHLNIAPGESVAFVGHTGAGKSTIAKLITRFYEFQSGQILVDGQDIRGFNLQSYRRQLGIVPQQPFLFSGTIMENVRYARPDASDGEIETLAMSIGGANG